MKSIRIKTTVFSVLMICLFIGCDKMEDVHKIYLEGGEKIYSARPINAEAYAGFNRIKLSWNFTSVGNLSEAFIRYDDREIGIPVTGSEDTSMVYILDNLEEKSYDLEIYSKDVNDNTSLITTVFGNSYGSEYQKYLSTHSLKNLIVENGFLKFSVSGDFKGLIGYMLKYQNKDGAEIEEFFDKTVAEHEIEVELGSELTIKSGYIPEIGAIDTIYSPPVTYDTPKSFILDKSLFKLANLPMDIPRFDPSVPDAEKDWLHAWDGDNGTVKVFLDANNPKPSFVTIDLGVKVQLTKFELVGFLPWTPITPKQYQVWGIGDDKDINEAATTVDIHDILSLSPEDQADPAKVAAKTAENFEAWKTESLDKGWTLLIDDNRADSEGAGYSKEITEETAIRYVRLVFIDNFHNTNPDIGLSEIFFTGMAPTE
ncbi:MAG: DUF4998 domain-containing protein [Cytophagales bacterium]|nr:DUF4998 domain-containing protein [Cytophagales bacterium]